MEAAASQRVQSAQQLRGTRAGTMHTSSLTVSDNRILVLVYVSIKHMSRRLTRHAECTCHHIYIYIYADVYAQRSYVLRTVTDE